MGVETRHAKELLRAPGCALKPGALESPQKCPHDLETQNFSPAIHLSALPTTFGLQDWGSEGGQDVCVLPSMSFIGTEREHSLLTHAHTCETLPKVRQKLMPSPMSGESLMVPINSTSLW